MYLQILGGFIFLLGGADILVRGAVGLAEKMNVSPLLIGMTIIAFGTSAPEFVVSLDAAMAGSSGMAIGNVIGSNMANMLLILGAAALVKPIVVKPYALMRDGISLLLGSLLFVWFCFSGDIGTWQGVVLVVVFAGFLGNTYYREVHGDDAAAEIHTQEVEEYKGLKTHRTIWMAIMAGLAGVIYGAELLVAGGVQLATIHGVPDEVIGLTVLAIGTSLPELAASVVAAMRGHADVALGNVVGSNLFNAMPVIGIVAMVTPLSVPDQILNFDLWVMLAVTVGLIPFLVGGLRLGRPVAASFLVAYGLYIGAQAYGIPGVF
ncbi:MAG: calcium/sodium antiporter [Rhodospirillaceae bacterium]|nr:calcium/sodium antiporter [Rhodospirillaceae bacterium]